MKGQEGPIIFNTKFEEKEFEADIFIQITKALKMDTFIVAIIMGR